MSQEYTQHTNITSSNMREDDTPQYLYEDDTDTEEWQLAEINSPLRQDTNSPLLEKMMDSIVSKEICRTYCTTSPICLGYPDVSKCILDNGLGNTDADICPYLVSENEIETTRIVVNNSVENIFFEDEDGDVLSNLDGNLLRLANKEWLNSLLEMDESMTWEELKIELGKCLTFRDNEDENPNIFKCVLGCLGGISFCTVLLMFLL